MKNKFKRIGYRVGMSLLLVVGLLLLFNKPIRNSIMANQTNEYKVSKVSHKTIKKNSKRDVSFDFSNVSAVSLSSIVEAQASKEKLPVIGGIAIPDVEINLPIFKGLGNAELSFGAGTMKKDQKMGERNYALASHHVFGMTGSSNMLFSPLDKAKKGMLIYLTDKERVYQYRISEIYIVDPTAVEVVEDRQGVNEVTLVTCTDAEATQRIIVKAGYEKSYNYTKASKRVIKAFEQDYNQIQP